MKTEQEVRDGIEKWSPEKRWIAKKEIAEAIEKGRSPEHNIALLGMAEERKQGQVQHGVLAEVDAIAGVPPHVHHTPEKVGLKHVTGPGSIFGFQGDVSTTEYKDLLAFAQGQGRLNAIKHIRENAEKYKLTAQ